MLIIILNIIRYEVRVAYILLTFLENYNLGNTADRNTNENTGYIFNRNKSVTTST